MVVQQTLNLLILVRVQVPQPDMKLVDFTVNNHKFKGTLFFPQNLKTKNPAILFIQGWTGEKERSYQYAEALAKLGYLSFLFDGRGHGKSEGNIRTVATREFLDDILQTYDYFTKIEGVDKENISVVGSSYGGYLATLLTTKRNVKRLALRVPADYPNETFNKSKMQTSGIDNPDIFAWRAHARNPGETFALDAIANFDGQILIVESENDTVVPHETVQNYVNAIKDKSRLTHTVIKGAPDSIKEGPFRDEVEKIYINWFKSYKD